jgi:hypothetical protein
MCHLFRFRFLTLAVVVTLTSFALIVPDADAQIGPITDPELAAEITEIKLPAVVGQTATAAGGRYILALLPSVRQIAVFDVNQAKVIKYIAMPSDDVVFTAGAEKLVVYLQEKKIIKRYSLETFEAELTVQLDIGGRVAAMTMGNNSSGPIVIAKEGGNTYHQQDLGLAVIDLETLKKIEVNYASRPNATSEWRKNTVASASADGTIFFFSSGEGVVFEVNEDQVRFVGPAGRSSNGRLGFRAMIDARGRYVYGSEGIFTSELVQIGKSSGNTWNMRRIPGINGDFYLEFNGGEDRKQDAPPPPISIHLAGSETPLVKVSGIDVATTEVRNYETPTPFQDIFFMPTANLIVYLGTSQDRFFLRKLDIEAQLEKSGIDYLYFTSSAPGNAQAGEKYTYPARVKSKAGEVKFSLFSAPPGMSVADDGTIHWEVPQPFDYSHAVVILAAADASGQQVLQTFRIKLGGNGGVAPDAALEVAANEDATAESADYISLPEITSMGLEKETIVPLPARFDQLCLGGGGRYIILHFDSLDKLGIFDTSTGKISGYLPMPGNQVGFAAGANRLVTLSTDLGIITRYNLQTRQRELSRPLSLPKAVTQTAMGHAADGPIFVSSGETVTPVNLKTLEVETFKAEGNRGFGFRGAIRISANGKTLTSWGGGSPSGLLSFVKTGDSWNAHYEHDSVGAILPSADGRLLFTNSGIYTSELAKVNAEGALYSPAAHGDFYLKISGGTYHNVRERGKVTVTLFRSGDSRPIVTLPIEPDFMDGDGWGRVDMTMEQRVIVLPRAELIVMMNKTRDQLKLLPFNLDKILDDSGIDYLLVASQAPESARLKQRYEYPIDVKSKRGNVRYELAAGPEGMEIDTTGKITWSIPHQYDEELNTVIVNIKDDSGQEMIHTFTVNIVDLGERKAALEAARKREQELAAKLAADRVQTERMAEIKRREEQIRLANEQRMAAEANRNNWLTDREKAIAEDDSQKPAMFRSEANEMRQWTDTLGNQLEASYVQVFAGSILLKLPDGSTLAVPGAKMSKADQDYAREKMRSALEQLNSWDQAEAARIARQGNEEQRKELELQSAKNMQKLLVAMRASSGPVTQGSLDRQSKIELLSWRVHLLPSLGHRELYEQFNLLEPWYSEHNRKLISQMPDVFHSPGSTTADGRTNYVLVTGDRCIVQPLASGSQELVTGRTPSETLPLIVEVNDALAVTWTRPDDLFLADANDNQQISYWFGARDHGLLTANVKGSVTKLLKTNPTEVIFDNFYFTKSSTPEMQLEEILPPVSNNANRSLPSGKLLDKSPGGGSRFNKE